MTLRVRSRPPEPSVAAGGPGDLGRLLETEARLEETLGHARDEAARLVTEARDAARALEAALGAELEAAAQRLEAEIASERDRAGREIAEAARREAERFDDVAVGRIAELARWVVERVIGGAP